MTSTDPTSTSTDTEALAVGIDFGGTKILGALVNAHGGIVAEHRVPTPHEGEPLLDAMAEVVTALEQKGGRQVIGLGVGAAGLVNREGVLCYSPNLSGLSNLALRDGMRKRLHERIVQVDNDANAAAWGECLVGAGARKQDMILVTLGTGIGGGLVVGGSLFRGRYGFGAEIGHMTVAAGGAQCGCGNLGCWEAYASGQALGRLGRESVARGEAPGLLELVEGQADKIRGEHVSQAVRQGDAGARTVMDDYSHWLATGIVNLVSVLDPEVVVIGGGMAQEADLYLAQTQAYINEHLVGAAHRPEVPVQVATLGEEAGVVGAAMLVHYETVDSTARS